MNLGDLNVKTQKKVLVFGTSGTGKTCFATGFPGPLFVADFDGKVSSAASFYAGSTELLRGIHYESYTPQPGQPVERPFEDYCRKLYELEQLAAKNEFPYKTFVLDSLTTYVDQMMKQVMKQNPGMKRNDTKPVKVAALQDYMILSAHFKDMLFRVLQLPCNVVITAHSQVDKDELTGEILRTPLLPGKLSSYLPVLFEEVYFTDVEQGQAGKTRYIAQTASDYRVKVRSQLKDIPAKVDLSYEVISKYF